MGHTGIDLPNMNNKWVEFELSNVDMSIIYVEFGLPNIDTTRTQLMDTNRHPYM